jgi:hypothetical protein
MHSKRHTESVRFSHDHECLDSLSVTKVIDYIPAHIGRVQKKSKEGMIVPHRHCPLDIECMPDGRIGFLFWS